MASDEMLSWLKATIEGDRAAAEKATPPPPFVLTEDADHLRRQNPRDTIARCEAELALLDKVDEAGRGLKQALAEHDKMDTALFTAALGAFMVAAKVLAKGRRHRPGFKPEWVSD